MLKYIHYKLQLLYYLLKLLLILYICVLFVSWQLVGSLVTRPYKVVRKYWIGSTFRVFLSFRYVITHRDYVGQLTTIRHSE